MEEGLKKGGFDSRAEFILDDLRRSEHNIQVANLGAPVEEWTVGETALTSLMDWREDIVHIHISFSFDHHILPGKSFPCNFVIYYSRFSQKHINVHKCEPLGTF